MRNTFGSAPDRRPGALGLSTCPQPGRDVARSAAVLCVVLIMLCLSASTPARAQNVSVTVDGRTLTFDQPPAMIDGRVFVPLRGIFESLGAQVRYDPATRSIQAQRGSTQIALAIGSGDASVNGRPVHMDVPAQTVGGRAMVPLRFVSEALGAEVHWNASTSTVAILSGGQTAQAPPPQLQPPPTQPEPREMPEISGLVVRADRMLRPGEVIRVEMTGTPNAHASFDVEQVQVNVPMREVSAGDYRGELRVTEDMHARRARVIGHLRAHGLSAVRESEERLTLNGEERDQPPVAEGSIFLNITSPAPDQRISDNFTLTGTTLPYARVTVRGTVNRALVPGIIGVNTQEFTFSGIADDRGQFQIPIQLGGLRNRGSISLQAQATDRQGRSTQWFQFQYATGP